MGNAFDTTRMQILQRGLAVLVVSSKDACGKHIVRVMLKIVVTDDAIFLGRVHPFQPFLILGKSLFGIVLLNDNQVAASFRVGIVLEQIIRQTERSNKVGLLKEVVDPDAVLLPVEIVPRRDECHHAAVAHCVKPFLHEVAVNGLGNHAVEQALAVAVERVVHLRITKGDVGDGEVVGAQLLLIYHLKSGSPHLGPVIFVEGGQQHARQFVFLEGGHLGIGIDGAHGVDEDAHTRRRLQHLLRSQVHLTEDTPDGFGYLLRGVECREDGLLHAGDVAFVVGLVLGILAYHPVEFGGQVVQWEVVLRPDGPVLHRIQHTFQPTETAVTGNGFPLGLSGDTYFLPHGKGCADGIDVGLQPCLPIERHTARCKVPMHQSTRYRAACSQASVQTQVR